MDGFERRRNEKKKAIMQTALELFDQFGFDRVTMTEIAKKAHVSKVSIYNFFESKDNLRRTIMKELFDDALAKKIAFLEADEDFMKKVSGFITLQTQYYEKYSLKFFFDAVESDPVIQQYFNEYTKASREFVLQFIEMGKQEKVFSPDISTDAMEIYIDIFQSYFLSDSSIKMREKIEHNLELAREINLLFIDGLVQQKNNDIQHLSI
jgi:AcrR family transcriptional regulator